MRYYSNAVLTQQLLDTWKIPSLFSTQNLAFSLVEYQPGDFLTSPNHETDVYKRQLVSFAIAAQNAGKVLTPEFKSAGHPVYLFTAPGYQALEGTKEMCIRDRVVMVLSGMSTLSQMEDNLGYMKSFRPLSLRELNTVAQAAECIRSQNLIPCTACRYCTAGCPRHIAIPDLFACMNARKKYEDWSSLYYYGVHTAQGGKASDCIRCGACEKICPQHLPIRQLLQTVAETFGTE